MRVAVISDIHGNAHALEAVLADLAREKPDAVWSLGDVVGYGPRPNRCCSLVADTAVVSLVGNHDLGVLGSIDLAAFAYEAAESARWTRGVLRDEWRSYLAGLASEAAVDNASIGLYHASPRDPVWEYVLTDHAARAAFAATRDELVLVGHSHVALAVSLAGDDLEGGLAAAGAELELAGRRWLLNPGSVGQPRDGDPRAAYLLLDVERRRAEFRRVPYDIEATQAEILERGLPEYLAARLEHGL